MQLRPTFLLIATAMLSPSLGGCYLLGGLTSSAEEPEAEAAPVVTATDLQISKVSARALFADGDKEATAVEALRPGRQTYELALTLELSDGSKVDGSEVEGLSFESPDERVSVAKSAGVLQMTTTVDSSFDLMDGKGFQLVVKTSNESLPEQSFSWDVDWAGELMVSQAGASGNSGSSGSNGFSGSAISGNDGTPGEDGDDGGDGQDGENGASAEFIAVPYDVSKVFPEQTAPMLLVFDVKAKTLQLAAAASKVVLSARGGQGGPGGEGGHGGKGGNGPTGDFNGGPGGRGANGGRGGRGGDGGELTVKCFPGEELLANVTLDVAGGSGGRAGRAGRGGDGGYRSSSSSSPGSDGSDGREGASGSAGREGRTEVVVVDRDTALAAISHPLFDASLVPSAE